VDGIRINDASLEISPTGLEALVNGQGAEVRVSRIDLSISPEALNTLVRGATPGSETAPSTELGDGRVRVRAEKDGKPVAFDLQIGALRLEITSGGIRVVSENAPRGGSE